MIMSTHNHVVVLVLGDVGRSPRMQYHALSFSNLPQVERVSLLGYRGERVIPAISRSDKIKVCPIEPYDISLFKKIKILQVLWKGIALIVAIALALLRLPAYDTIIIQNPPGIPAVLVAMAFSLWNSSKVVVDWHNLGFSVFQEQLGKHHVLVKLSRFLEQILCAQASHHLCVSKALQCWLKTEFSVDAIVFYDRPAAIFQADSMDVAARQQLLHKLGFIPEMLFPAMTDTGVNLQHVVSHGSSSIQSTTQMGQVALLMSATSWTPDENFNILLQALTQVETFLAEHHTSMSNFVYNHVLCVITGKGEMKTAFEQEVAALEKAGNLGKFVLIRTKWLEAEEYPKLMSCADLGISLHTSTSGLDLPMKVLDMFGSGVPVCAVEFPTLVELLQHDKNGMVFRSSEELSSQLIHLLFNEKNIKLNKLKAEAGNIEHWEEHWVRIVKPYLFQ